MQAHVIGCLKTRWVAAIGLAACLMAMAPLASADDHATGSDDLHCGPPPPAPDETKGRRDFRTLDATDEGRGDLRVFEQFHLSKAQKNLAEGRPQYAVKDLDFVLRRVPNHERALRLLLELSKVEKARSGTRTLGCYFVWARDFVTNDVTVLSYGGYYFWKSNKTELAIEWWDAALAIDPDAPEVNYNLGLAYFSMHEYSKARTHAWSAYEAGYPLSGLRQKLRDAGEWREPEPRSPPPANP